MEELIINRISRVPSRARLVPTALDVADIPFTPIGCANWQGQYPYKPEVKFRMAYADDSLLLHYVVTEASVAAVAADDGGRVWEDSCCEFFSQPFDDGLYYNMECNAAGKLLIACGGGREGREAATASVYNQVKRWSELGRAAFPERVGKVTWQLALIIPYSVWFKHHIRNVHGMNMRANFYKCGDKLSKPHFLSWNPVGAPRPDFHRPEFFGKIHFR